MRPEGVKLDRRYRWDPKNEKYNVRALLPSGRDLRGRGWPLNLLEVLDQSPEENYDGNGCTGFSEAHGLAASPAPVKGVTKKVAIDLYHAARRHDEWPGEDYEGSSILGSALGARELGYIGEFRWAMNVDDALAALSHIGPLHIGSDWTEDMFDPDPHGVIRPTGSVAGGHAYLATGLLVAPASIRRALGLRSRVPLENPDDVLVYGPNSWSKRWGHYARSGFWLMWASDLERLLKGISYPGEIRINPVAFRRSI
jgi:hypothetical protein